MRFFERFFTASILAAGCWGASCATGPDETGESCGNRGPCEAGSICLGELCAQLCTSDIHCSEAGSICEGDVCVLGQRTDAPVILGINGDSAEDPAIGHTDNHVHRRMTILGENLSGVAVHLVNEAGESHELNVCSAGNTEIEVELPDEVSSGMNLLSVVTGAGMCQSTLPVIQGDPGQDGPKGDTGDTGQQGARGAQGDTGARGAQGARGPQGDAGDTGPQGARGPQGAIGSRGPQGARGEQGLPGIGWGANTCVFQASCGAGLVDRGLAGYITNGSCPFVAGGGYEPSPGWAWCHPHVCCTF